jgi:serine/threonine protein kinase
MDYSSRWQIIKSIGQGGQGQVFRVYDASKLMGRQELISAVESFIRQLGGPIMLEERQKPGSVELFRRAVIDVIRMDDPAYQGALKILHQAEEARNADSANDRIKLEIQAMSNIVHPNLLKILEADTDSRWFVSQYHPNGTLVENQHQFVGNFAKALRAFRPLVEGVSELHKQGRVHRDIKPQNVFFDAAN